MVYRLLLLFYNKGIATKVRSAFDKRSFVSVSTFSSFAKRLVEAADPAWWEAQTEKDDQFWHLILPSKLLDIDETKQPKFDAIIVDEGQDFKPEWYEYLQTLLKPGPDSRFCVFLDEHQDIFGHWKHFPCSPPAAKKVLSKNCRNTRSIVDFLTRAYPVQMTCFEKSPAGVPVIQRSVQNDVDETDSDRARYQVHDRERKDQARVDCSSATFFKRRLLPPRYKSDCRVPTSQRVRALRSACEADPLRYYRNLQGVGSRRRVASVRKESVPTRPS